MDSEMQSNSYYYPMNQDIGGPFQKDGKGMVAKEKQVFEFSQTRRSGCQGPYITSKIINLNLLTLALASYSDLVKDYLGAEDKTLGSTSCVTKTKEQLPERYRDIANDLDEYDPDEQLRLLIIYDRMNESDAQPSHKAEQGSASASARRLANVIPKLNKVKLNGEKNIAFKQLIDQQKLYNKVASKSLTFLTSEEILRLKFLKKELAQNQLNINGIYKKYP